MDIITKEILKADEILSELCGSLCPFTNKYILDGIRTDGQNALGTLLQVALKYRQVVSFACGSNVPATEGHGVVEV